MPIGRILPQLIQRKYLALYCWLSRVRMNSEKAASARRISVDRLAPFAAAVIGDLRTSGLVVFRGLFLFILFLYEIGS